MIDELQWAYQSALRGPRHDLQGHMAFLRHAAASRHAPVIIEAGVRSGMSTRAFLLGARQTGGLVWSVDLAPATVPDVIRGHPQWRFLQADDLSSQAQAWLPAACDVLFLDAHDDNWTIDRLRNHVLSELQTYVPRVRPGGLVLLHDTQWQPPDIDLGEPAGGVAMALDDYCSVTGRDWSNKPGSYGLGIMRIT